MGCDKVSAGCKNCYAEALTRRFTNHFKDGFEFTPHPERLDEPRRWGKPSRMFVNSMSDLFHERMPLEYLKRVFEVMADCDQHVFQILTKRQERLLELAPELPWPDNVWMGVSVENQTFAHRVDYLRQVPATVRFLSCEPLIGPLDLRLRRRLCARRIPSDPIYTISVMFGGSAATFPGSLQGLFSTAPQAKSTKPKIT